MTERALQPEPELLPCPVCGSRVLAEIGGYEICTVCGWEDDPVQRDDPDYAGGANDMSLREAREAWQRGGERAAG